MHLNNAMLACLIAMITAFTPAESLAQFGGGFPGGGMRGSHQRQPRAGQNGQAEKYSIAVCYLPAGSRLYAIKTAMLPALAHDLKGCNRRPTP